VYPSAKHLALQALAIDDSLARAHLVLAWKNLLLDWALDAAMREVRGPRRRPGGPSNDSRIPSVPDPNRTLFETVFRLLAPVLDELVVGGGCTKGLFLTDPGAGAIRLTKDVDAIVHVPRGVSLGRRGEGATGYHEGDPARRARRQERCAVFAP
jgi:hypothetical protein